MARIRWDDTPNPRVTEAAAELLKQVSADHAAITFTSEGAFELHDAAGRVLRVNERTVEALTRAGLITKQPRYVISARGRKVVSTLE